MITTVRPCRACGRADSRPFGEKAGCAIWECAGCGALFPGTHAASAGDLYDACYEHALSAIPASVAASLERLVASAESFRQQSRWLDVGFGEGAVLSAAERHGWICHGTEVSTVALGYGRRRGWIVAAESEDSRFGDGTFDVVTMLEVLEHVPEPRAVLGAAARWLRPGGLLYLTTPNAESLNRRLLGIRWSVISPPDHATLWTARGLSRALEAAGFSVCKLRTEGYNPADLLAKCRAGGAVDQPVNRNDVGRALSESLSRSASRRAAKRVTNAGLNVMRLGDTLKAWARRGD